MSVSFYFLFLFLCWNDPELHASQRHGTRLPKCWSWHSEVNNDDDNEQKNENNALIMRIIASGICKDAEYTKSTGAEECDGMLEGKKTYEWDGEGRLKVWAIGRNTPLMRIHNNYCALCITYLIYEQRRSAACVCMCDYIAWR